MIFDEDKYMITTYNINFKLLIKRMDSSSRVPSILSFVQAAEHGSFAAAARSLGISSSAVSKNVASLERALGVRLMNRTTRSLQMTAEGQAFFERARVAIDALDEAIDTVAAQRAEPVGRVRLSTSSAFGNQYVLPVLPELVERHPALRFEVDFDDRRVDLVKDGYDLALRGGKARDSSLVSRRVCTLYTVLVASPDYLARHGTPAHSADLLKHRLIVIRFLNGRRLPWHLGTADGVREEFEPTAPVLTVSAPEAAVEAAMRGIGIAQAGVHHAWHLLRDGRLKIVMPSYYDAGESELSLQYPHRALLAPRVKVTAEFLLDKLAQVDALHATPTSLYDFAA